MPSGTIMAMFRRWTEGTIQSLLATLIVALIPGAAVTYLVKVGSVWAVPLMMGLGAAVLTAILVLALDAIRRLPPKRVVPTTSNIERVARDWLDNFNVAVQRSPNPLCHFRFMVTVDSGTKMMVGRLKETHQNYVVIRSAIAPTDDDLKQIESLAPDQKNILVGELRLELARRHVGYENLALPVKDFAIFKRVPITESLNEHEFIAALDEVEAAVHAVSLVYGLFVARAKRPDNKPELIPVKAPKSLDS